MVESEREFWCEAVEGVEIVSVSLWPGEAVSEWPGEAVSVAPGQFLVQRAGNGLFAAVSEVVGARGGVIDVTDAWALWRVGGREIRRILAGFLPIDLHPRAFVPGQAATTLGAHMTVRVRMIDAAPTYELAVSRSFSGSFLRTLALCGAGRYQGVSAGVA